MSTQPDWSKAPEGATHAMTTGPKWGGGSHIVGSVEYAKLEDGRYRCWGSDDIFVIGAASWVVLAERPLPCDSAPLSDAVAAAWSGDGMPPVGTVCEVSNCGNPFEICTIRYMGSELCVVDHTMPHRDQHYHLSSVKFRPIRTPEQIAAEERADAVNDMLSIISGIDYDRASLVALYDAGYRKQVAA